MANNIINVVEWYQGNIYVDSNTEINDTNGLRSGYVPIKSGVFAVSAVDTDGNALVFSFLCYDADGNFVQTSKSNGYKASGTVIDITDMSGIASIRIVLSGDTAITPSQLQSCAVHFEYWYIDDGDITHTEFIEPSGAAMSAPYPSSLWRIDPMVNNGIPYHDLLPGVETINLWAQSTDDYIHIYDSRETDFTGNGYAIIEPIECEVRHEKNGMYEASMTVHIDDYGKFDYLRNNALLKIPIRYHDETIYQIFRIYSVAKKMDSSGNLRIEIAAKHIFYDLNDRLLIDCRPTGKNGKDAINWIMDGAYGVSGQYDVDFSFTSDISKISTAYYENVSVTAALLGTDNSFVNRWGGSLYRDNNYFSINSEMENSRQTGYIRYAHNMIEIDFTVDYSECITYLIAEDNFGNKTTVVNESVPNAVFPHHRYKYVKFNYDTEDIEQFRADVQSYFDNYKNGAVNIKVKFADLTDVELYKDFLQLADFEVGDKVIVYHEELDINYSNLEIISKTYNVNDRQSADIEIGSFKNAISRSAFMSGTVSSGSSAADKQMQAMQSQLDEVAFDTYITTPITTIDGKYLTTVNGKYLVYKE